MSEEHDDPDTWRVARDLAKHLVIPVGPYDPRVPTPEEFNAVLPYLINRAAKFYRERYFCENAELTLAHLLGMNVPSQGFPEADGYSRKGYDWAGYTRDGFDANGYNREGFDRKGFDKKGRNAEGFDRYGYDVDGFNKDGINMNGKTRKEHIELLVSKWSDEFSALVAAEAMKRFPDLAEAEAEPQPEPTKAKAQPRKATARPTRAAPRAKRRQPEPAPA